MDYKPFPSRVHESVLRHFFVGVCCSFVMLCCLSATAQVSLARTISTFAGSSGTLPYSGDSGPATSADLYLPTSTAVDTYGNVYIADSYNYRVRVVYYAGTIANLAGQTLTPGNIYTVAGNGSSGYSGDGQSALNAQIGGSRGIAVDSAGNLYISDANNSAIRKVSNGIITTYASGPQLGLPEGIALDSLNNLYVADSGLQTVVKIAPGGSPITTVAGNGYVSGGYGGYNGDNIPATSAELNWPWGVTVDPAGNIYIAEVNGYRVREVFNSGSIPNITSPTIGNIYTIAGDGLGGSQSCSGCVATSTNVIGPQGVVLDSVGNIYIAQELGLVSEITNGIITTIAGDYNYGFSGDNGPATEALMSVLYGLSLNGAGDIFAADYGNNRIRKVSSPISITFPPTYVGQTSPVQNVYLVTNASETITVNSAPNTITGLPDFNVNTAGMTGCTNGGSYSAGTVCSVPITCSPQFAGQRMALLTVTYSNGSGTGTSSFPMSCVGIGSQLGFTPGIITTIAGNGTSSYTGDGTPATNYALAPGAIAVDGNSNVYAADTYRVRRIDGITDAITTVAGNGNLGYAGDGGLATNAEVSPFAVALDAEDNIYISNPWENTIHSYPYDWLNSRIRVVYNGGTIPWLSGLIPNDIYAVAGTNPGVGTTCYPVLANVMSPVNPDAVAESCPLPESIAVDSAGNIFISDNDTAYIYEIYSSGSIPGISGAIPGSIYTIAGNGTGSYTGDGPAIGSGLGHGACISVDSFDNVYTCDSTNNVVRVIYRGGSIPGILNPLQGYIYTIAGNGSAGYGGDGGPATSAQLSLPASVAVDSVGDVFIADQSNNRIREVSNVGVIATVVNSTGTLGFSGDGALAVNAETDYPNSVAVDGSGNLFLSDSGNYRVRKVTVNQSAFPFVTSTFIGNMDSTDGPQVVTVYNNGNAPMVFTSPSSGTNPSIGPDFAYDYASTCPLLNPGSTYTLAPGASCTYAVDFIPTATGAFTESLILTTNDPNTPNATAVLTGQGTDIPNSCHQTLRGVVICTE